MKRTIPLLKCFATIQILFTSSQEKNFLMIRILAEFKPHIIESYQTKEWANTITMGPPATVYLMEANDQTCKLLQHYANCLYDWVAPKLPEDLTFIKNSFTWFSSTTHEEFGGFSIRSDYYRKLIHTVPGLKIQRIELE
jgi:hypothetical protein